MMVEHLMKEQQALHLLYEDNSDNRFYTGELNGVKSLISHLVINAASSENIDALLLLMMIFLIGLIDTPYIFFNYT